MKRFRTFKRTAKNFEQFARARKLTVDRGLTMDEARRACEAFNSTRTPAQVRAGTMMEFESE